MVKKLALGLVLVATVVVTPYFLQPSPEGFSFGEPEVRAAVEGRWRVQAAERTVELAIQLARAPAQSAREPGWVREAAACGQRTLVRSAGACLDITNAELEVRVADGRPVRGRVEVRGLRFHHATLEIELPGQSLRAVLTSTGEVSEASLGGAPATFVRVSDI